MQPTTLPRGTTLLLFPEDVNGAIATPTYSKVKSSRGNTVSVQVDGATSGAAQTLKLSRAVALSRRVNLGAEGELQLGTWVRKAVCAMVDGEYRYGQVTGYSAAALIVSTSHGPIEVNLDAICGEVYPVIAMTMWCQQFPASNWNYPALEQIHDAMFTTIINPTNPGQGPPSVAELMRDHNMHVSPAYDCLILWTDALTGFRTRVSIQHVINHVYYVDGNAPLPPQLEHAFGSSFCQQSTSEVASSRTLERQPRRIDQSNSTPAQSSAHNASNFFDPTVGDDEVETAADEVSVAQVLLANEPPSSRRHNTASHATPGITMTATNRIPAPIEHESAQEHEIRELIRLHKPHLLPYHLDARRPATLAPTTTLPNRLDEELPPTKRSKFTFNPSLEQRRVHELITAEVHKGKSPSVFVESMVSNKAITMWAYPGVSTRAYDFQFGSRGLSILHFTPVEQIERLRRQRENFISMSDFSVSAKFIPAPDPSSWEDVLAAANGFQQYCAFMCDSITKDIASTTYTLFGTLRARKLWLKTSFLHLYCGLTPNWRTTQVAATMNPFNPELQGILFSSKRERMDELQLARDNSSRDQNGERPQQRSRSQYGRKGDSAASLIPRHEGKQVCLKYLSKRGCSSSDLGICVSSNRVHFFPAALTDKLKNYLRRKFGGVNAKYGDN